MRSLIFSSGNQVGNGQVVQNMLIKNAIEVCLCWATVKRLVWLDDQDWTVLADVQAAREVALEISGNLRIVELVSSA